MMADINVVFNLFQAIANTIPEAVAQANQDVADQAVANIQARIIANGQVETGTMLNSVHDEAQSDGSQNVIVDCQNEEGEYYAAYPNYGTIHQAANPFFEPGLEDTQDAMDEALAGIVAAMAKAGR